MACIVCGAFTSIHGDDYDQSCIGFLQDTIRELKKVIDNLDKRCTDAGV